MEERSRDFLSQLPTDVLLSILEKLDLREAVRAGVLSRRWRRLPSQLSRLVLRHEDFLPQTEDGWHRYYDDVEDGEEARDVLLRSNKGRRPRDALSDASDAMLRVATALLASRSAGGEVVPLPSCTVAVAFLLRHNYLCLGRLLNAAVATGKVRAVELEVYTTSDLYQSNDVKKTSNAMAVYGRRFRMALFDRFPALFGGLTRLHLENMYLSVPDDLSDILGTCTALESLSLVASGVFRPKRLWSVRHARLADMTIAFCTFQGVDLVWLPNLERFAYKNWDSTYDYTKQQQQPLSFGHVPRLKTLILSNTLYHGHGRVIRLSQILANTTAVSHLRLNFRGRNVWVKPEASKRFINIFRNLKHLRIRNVHQECDLPWTMFLLQAAPNLKELCIKLWDHECDFQLDENLASQIPINKNKSVVWEVPADLKHYNLARLTILGFYSTGSEAIVSFLRSLVQAAVNLEEMHIRKKASCQECEEVMEVGSFPRIDEDKDALRRSISGGRSTPFKMYIQQC